MVGGGHFEPVVSDLDKDGKKEIIIYKGGAPPKILVYNADGVLLWSANVGIGKQSGGNNNMPLVGDIDNDGFDEILVFNIEQGNSYSRLYAFNHDGSLLWSVEFINDYHPTLLMADLDLDGNKEIVIQCNDARDEKMVIINNQGEIISEWDLPDKTWGGSIDPSPAIGNFDNDPELEIVSVGPSENAGGIWEDGQFLGWNNEGIIYIYNMDGSVVEGWPIHTLGVIFSSPVVGDINNDGFEEIVIGLMSEVGESITNQGGGVYAFDREGNVLPGWPFKRGDGFWSTPALGDIDYDGDLEISISQIGFETYLLHHDATLMEGWPQIKTWVDYYSSLMGDINNDGVLDVLTTAGNGFMSGGVYAWNSDGTLIDGFPKVTQSDAQAPAVIDDIDNDGKLELIASSDWDFDFVNEEFKHEGSIYVWDLDGSYDELNMDWPRFQHDTRQTGNYDGDRVVIPSRKKSYIANHELFDISGTLLMTLKVAEGGLWKTVQTVKDEPITVSAESVFGLAPEWNPLEVSVNETGRYLVSAQLENKDGEVLDGLKGSLLAEFEFEVA